MSSPNPEGNGIVLYPKPEVVRKLVLFLGRQTMEDFNTPEEAAALYEMKREAELAYKAHLDEDN